MKLKRRKARSEDILADFSGLSPIGRGPFATVYGAVEKASGRPVALKVFEPEAELDNAPVSAGHVPAAQITDLLARGSEGLARVDHPNLITPRRIGSTADGWPLVVMDLCADSLAHVIDTKGPMSAHDVAGIGFKIAGALVALHDNGLLHQNIKPSNLLLTLMGEPALSDPGQTSFQLSVRAIASGSRFTAFHSPPEMFEAGELSPATDVYELASTMHQLLSGRAPFQPFDGESAISVVLRILRDPVAPLPTGVPFALGRLIESALAKDPRGRPQSAHAFADALREVSAREGWTVAVATTRAANAATGTTSVLQPEDHPAGDQPPGQPRQRFRRRNRRGVSEPPKVDRNVVLPEGTRRGSMDKPPRRS